MLSDLRSAFSFLTLLPLGYPSHRKAGYSFTYYPLVGMVIGVCLTLIAMFAPFSSDLKAFAVLICWVVITGGLHLDGFADACDGLLATTTPDKRLEIMKDPRTGAWAVIGLVMLLLGKWLLIRELSPLALFLPPIVGRWAMVWMVYAYPYARASGLGAFFREGLGRSQWVGASVILACSLAIVCLWNGRIIAILAIVPAVMLLFGRWVCGRLGGGITGDVYGATCELVEWTSLVVILWASA